MEKANASDGAAGGLVSRPSAEDFMSVKGTFYAELIRDGQVIWTDTFNNLVTTEGKNSMLDKYLGLGAAYAQIAMGLHTTIGNAGSTYATPSPQVEIPSASLTNAGRPVPAFSAAGSGSKATSAAVVFNINGTAAVSGCFIALGASSSSTTGVCAKGDVAASPGVLLSTGNFSTTPRNVIAGDTLNVTYSLAL